MSDLKEKAAELADSLHNRHLWPSERTERAHRALLSAQAEALRKTADDYAGTIGQAGVNVMRIRAARLQAMAEGKWPLEDAETK